VLKDVLKDRDVLVSVGSNRARIRLKRRPIFKAPLRGASTDGAIETGFPEGDLTFRVRSTSPVAPERSTASVRWVSFFLGARVSHPLPLPVSGLRG
jgi:hypothetical protein